MRSPELMVSVERSKYVKKKKSVVKCIIDNIAGCIMIKRISLLNRNDLTKNDQSKTTMTFCH